MSIGTHETFVRIVGEPYLSRALAFKEAKALAEKAWSKFALDRGATHYSGHRTLESLTFANPKARPKGWGQPSRKGRSFPNSSSAEGRAELLRIAELPKFPSPWEVFPEEEVPAQLKHKGPGKGDYGGGCFTRRFEPAVCWVGDDLYGLIGDVASAAKEWLAENPKGSVEDNAESWTIPEGLERVSEARFDYEVAKYKLEREEAKRA